MNLLYKARAQLSSNPAIYQHKHFRHVVEERFSSQSSVWLYFNFSSIWSGLQDEPFITEKQTNKQTSPKNNNLKIKKREHFPFPPLTTHLIRGEVVWVITVSRCTTCCMETKIFISRKVRFSSELMEFLKFKFSQRRVVRGSKWSKKANYQCQNVWIHAEPDESRWQMRINLTVNKSAGSKCSFTGIYVCHEWANNEKPPVVFQAIEGLLCCYCETATRWNQTEFMSPVKIKHAVIAALCFPAETTKCAECGILTRIVGPIIPAPRYSPAKKKGCLFLTHH